MHPAPFLRLAGSVGRVAVLLKNGLRHVQQKFCITRRLFSRCHRRCRRLADDFFDAVVNLEGPTLTDGVKVLKSVITHHHPVTLGRLLNAFSVSDLWAMIGQNSIVLSVSVRSFCLEEVEWRLLCKQGAHPVLRGPVTPRHGDLLPHVSQ